MTQDSATRQRHFTEELAELKRRLLQMGGLAEERVRLSVRGLVDREAAVLADVIAGDDDLNKFHVEIDDRCFKLLALHQPVAGDLRTIVAVGHPTERARQPNSPPGQARLPRDQVVVEERWPAD